MAVAHAKLDLTVTFEVPSPDPSQAKEARITFEQSPHPSHGTIVGLVPGGRFCKPAPIAGLRCSVHVSLVNEDFTYTVAVLDGQGRVTFARRATVLHGASPFLAFVLINKWTTAAVSFTDPAMGAPSRTPLLVTAYYKNTQEQLGGIVVGDQPFVKPILLADSDKSGATKITPATVTSPAAHADLLYDGKSFLNPWIVAKGQLNGRQRFIPFLRVHEYELPSHNRTSNNAGHGRLFVNDDGSVTFLEDTAIGRIDSNGTIEETKLPLYEFDIAKGPDDNPWALVSGGSGSALARINDDGSLTQYPLPGTNLGPFVLGPDGNFWTPASSSSYNSIVRRITPTGTVTDFPVPGTQGSLVDLVSGGDGNLWFVGTGQKAGGASPTSLVVKVEPNGAYFQYWLPGGDSSCCQAAVDDPVWADGKLYAALVDTHLGQVTEDGAFRQFPANLQMETASASPPVIPPMALGPDGALWYAANVDSGDCSIGHITTSGVVTFVRFASSCSSGYLPNALPNAFVAGPDDTMWYTRADVVGKISL